MSDNQSIRVSGAREHNLRGVNLVLPRNQFVVFTGVSGSGKSSLAFDTLFAEGQRRYIESLSSYARQFLGQMQKPDVDFISGLSPTISIQQKAAGRNPRSTVGTITEIYDYLRVLFARVSEAWCPQCGKKVEAQSREQIIARILAIPHGTRLLILAPLIRAQKGEYKDLFEDLLRQGYVRARVDGVVHNLNETLNLDRKIKHTIEVVIDRLKVEPDAQSRVGETVEQALHLGKGNLIVAMVSEAAGSPVTQELLFSSLHACVSCGASLDPPSPQMFGFNSPQGMCLDCDGLGIRYTFDPDLLIPDTSLSFRQGAIPLVGKFVGMGRWRKHIFEGLAKTLAFDIGLPWRDLPTEHQRLLLHGSGTRHIAFEWKMRGGNIWKHGGVWEGVVPQLMASFKKTASGPRKAQLDKYMRVLKCASCLGQRLNPQARAARVAGKTLWELCSLPVGDLAQWFDPVQGPLGKSFSPTQAIIATEVLKEIRGRIGFLLNLGLEYLTLARSAPTLSGGEAQRIRLAGQIGCGLVGVLYILDEPSIGLHPADNDRLLKSLKKLRDLGNTVLVVEHDEDTMRAADYLVDFGPGPGVRGGEVVATGNWQDLAKNPRSLTGKYLSRELEITRPGKPREGAGAEIRVLGARQNNLRNLEVGFPLGRFICVTGPSGSGKSSLLNEILRKGLVRLLRQGNQEESSPAEAGDLEAGPDSLGDFDAIKGSEAIDKVIDIDQTPIGRTPRSNPATYIKVFDEIRQLMGEMPESKVRGYAAGRFSFNLAGGRCEACEGNGSNRLEMDFLADVWVSCPVCEGKRFNRETLQVRYKGKNIQEILEMDIQEALEHFKNHPKIRAMIQSLHDVGLDYMKLGQPAPTLSGGEAQRIKLARELCKRSTGRTLYLLDEPTTGLHFDDIKKLLNVLHGFVDAGNTVIVIEHNLDVIKTADWVIDLGPEGGVKGGALIFEGPVEKLLRHKKSKTGLALAAHLRLGKNPGGGASAMEPATAPSMEGLKAIRVEGACQHNLRNLTVSIPRDQMTVCSGPSGSGKSSFSLDTVYAEGQRRYIESLSAYARQFLGKMQKPKVEHVSGLSPAIAIEQKSASKSPRSTVGTVTEIHDYLRVLYCRLGVPHCPDCGIPVGTQTTDEIIAKITSFPEGTKLYLLAQVERQGQESYDEVFEEIKRAGFIRVRIDGKIHLVENLPSMDHRRKHRVEVVIDRLVIRPGQRSRISDSVETGLNLGKGMISAALVEEAVPEEAWKVEAFSLHFSCGQCGRGFEQLNPHHFSFNSPLGWCPVCEGLGRQQGANPALLVRDKEMSLMQGALTAWPPMTEDPSFLPFARAIAKRGGFSLENPMRDLSREQQKILFHGMGEEWLEAVMEKGNSILFQYKGVFPALDEASRASAHYRQKLESWVGDVSCGACQGSRLREDASAFRLSFGARAPSLTLGKLQSLPLGESCRMFSEFKLDAREKKIAGELVREILGRIQLLVDIGLEYLTLDRPSPTLSGGESQRIRLASQVGSGLTGVLYVLDEPTIGLHPRDNARLLAALKKLRNLGNTLILVEHDREVISSADHLLDFGPGAGDQGGRITGEGPPALVMKNPNSLTGQYLSGKKFVPIPLDRRLRPGAKGLFHCKGGLVVLGARQNNLQNLQVTFPLGALVGVSGMSGSGKSSLVNEVLYQTLARRLNRARFPASAHDDILGLEQIDKVINVDQDPIGNSPQSNPATYTGLFDHLRELFSRLPDAKVRGYLPRRFSFNKPGGRCDACEGNGQKRIEMHFLPDVWVECEICKGKRYNPDTLSVCYKGRSIVDVLEMRVSTAREVFAHQPVIRRILQTLEDVGLGYMALGQPAPTLSGGEAQRVKLAAELSRPSTGKTLYLLDEPTTGLHFDDVRKLLEVLHRLVELGNTVIVVEHNLDVLKNADWIIDLGPEAGNRGGLVVAQGTPEAVAIGQWQNLSVGPRLEPFKGVSHTGRAIKTVLLKEHYAERTTKDPACQAGDENPGLNLEELGSKEKMPWQVDGKAWHTRDRVSLNGQTPKWEGEALLLVEELIQGREGFKPTDWSERGLVEITGEGKPGSWFFHGLTSHEWILGLVFRVPKNTFKQEELNHALGIPTLNDTAGVQVYGNGPRVRVRNMKRGPWQGVSIYAFRKVELETPAFREFLNQGMGAYLKQSKRVEQKPEDFMPWKKDGEKWHLGEKGFPVGKKATWDRALLKEVMDLFLGIKGIRPKWDSRDAVTFKAPRINHGWVMVKTKLANFLELRFFGPRGAVNHDSIKDLGCEREIQSHRGAGDLVVMRFTQFQHFSRTRLAEFLDFHVKSFQSMDWNLE